MKHHMPAQARTLGTGAFVTLLFCVIIAALDHSIINVALPVIGKHLHIQQSGLQWVAASYTIAFAAGLFVAGRLADRYGRRRMLLVGLSVFALSTMYAALARDAGQLIAGRALIGLGGTLLLPSTLAIITSEAPEDKKPHMIGLWSAFFGIGITIGPLLGGWLLSHYSWTSVFWVNVPLTVLAGLLVLRFVPRSPGTQKPPLHLLDGVISALGIAGVVTAIIQAPVWNLTSTLVYGICGAVLLFWFWRRQLRITDPLIDTSMFSSSYVSISTAAILLFMAAMAGTIFLIVQFMELVSQYSALKTGVALLPMTFGLVMGSISSAGIQQHRSPKLAMGLGSGIAALGFAVLAVVLTTSTSPWLVSTILALTTIGLGMSTAAATTIITGGLPTEKAGITSALNDASREIGGAIGVAILGSTANWLYRHRVSNITDDSLHETVRGGLSLVRAAHVPPEVLHSSLRAFTSGTRVALYVAAGVLAILSVVIHTMLPSRGLVARQGAERRWFMH